MRRKNDSRGGKEGRAEKTERGTVTRFRMRRTARYEILDSINGEIITD